MVGLLAAWALAAPAGPRVFDLAAAVAREGVVVEHPEPGVARLVRPSANPAAATLAELPVPGPLGVQATVTAAALWHRDAVVRVTWLAADGRALGSFTTPPVYRHQDRRTVTAYGSPPAGTERAAVTLELVGAPRADLDAGCAAEFREVSLWDAPEATWRGPPLGIAWLGERLEAALEVALPADCTLSAELVDGFGAMVTSWPVSNDGGLALRAELPPGYYELRWRADRADGSLLRHGQEPLAVLDGAARSTDSPWAMDAGLSWGGIQRGDDDVRAQADLLRRLGFHTVRDRLSLREVWRRPEQLELGAYQRAGELQREAGLRVYQILHDLPPRWSIAPDDPAAWQAPVSDLRDFHAAMRAIAHDSRGLWSAFELWNEPDIPMFFAGRPEEYAGLLKAGYLGLKAGNPELEVLSGSAAHPLGDWLGGVFDCGAADYFDTFNWHTYHPFERVPQLAAEFRARLVADGYDAPQWLTETGSTCEPTLADERRQAADYVQRYALAAAARIERVFAFYWQEWRNEGEAVFGVVRPDRRPRPALAALSTLTRLLGRGLPLGREPTAGATVLWFETGDGTVAVAWSTEPVALPGSLAGGSARSLFGAPLALPAQLGPEPIYVLGRTPPAGLEPPPPAPSRRVRSEDDLEALSIVLDLRLLPTGDARLGGAERKEPPLVAPGDVLPAELSVYHFGRRPAAVRVRIDPPAGWRVEGAPRSIDLRPGQRSTHALRCLVEQVAGVTEPMRLRAVAEAPGFRIAPVEARARADVARLPTQPVRALGALPAARSRWTSASNEGTTVILSTPPEHDEQLRLSGLMAAPRGDRWGFANLALEEAEQLAAGDGLRFRLAPLAPWSEELLVILFESDGSQYLASAGSLADGAERTVTLVWTMFRHNAGVSAEENERLDLEQVRRIGIGFSARSVQQRGALDLWGLELVRLGGTR